MDRLPIRRGRNQRGNAFVEFGLAMLPYFALVFGILDFSMAMFIDNMIQSATREGVRYAITYNTFVGGVDKGSQTAAIKAVAQSVSMGFLNGSNANYVLVNYYAPSDLSTPLTGSGRNAPGNVVEVRVQNLPWNWMVPMPKFMVGTGLTMSASSSDVLQNLPAGVTTPPAP